MSIATQAEPTDGWAGAVVCADEDPEGAFGICRALRKRDSSLEPVLLLVTGAQLAELEIREDLFDDFCLTPFHQKELEARLRHLFWRTRSRQRVPRSSSTATSCSTSRPTRPRSQRRPLDLTYMEYELPEVLRDPPGQGVHARAAALAGVGLRVLRRRAHGRRARAAARGRSSARSTRT